MSSSNYVCAAFQVLHEVSALKHHFQLKFDQGLRGGAGGSTDADAAQDLAARECMHSGGVMGGPRRWDGGGLRTQTLSECPLLKMHGQ